MLKLNKMRFCSQSQPDYALLTRDTLW